MKAEKLGPTRRRWLRITSYGLALLLVLGAAYQQFGQWRDAVNHPPAGRLVNVGDHRLHVYCEGEGSPTVVAEAGGGDFSIVWRQVQPVVAEQTRFCSYDRAGYGWSDYSGRIPIRQEVSTDLYSALTAIGVEGPYVMVGHSLGGVYVRDFAFRYPDEVAGMVLVDSSLENQTSLLPDELRIQREGAMKWIPRLAPICQAMTLVGITRATRFWWLVTEEMEDAARSAYVVTRNRTRFCSALRNEFLAFDDAMGQTGGPTKLRDIPLIVLSHGLSEPTSSADAEWEESWQVLQAELATLSPDGELRTVDDASHMIQVDRPDAVTDAILDVVARVHM